MFIKVLSAGAQDAKDTVFCLAQDKWNDFSFETQYQLYLSSTHSDDGEPMYIGAVKVLKKGQTKSDTCQLQIGELLQLDNNFCSLGQSLDYYQRLAGLDKALKNKLLLFLRDVVVNPEYIDEFKDEDGWKDSLLRFVSLKDDLFTIAPILLSGDFTALPSLDLQFEFKTSGLINPVSFKFDSPTYGMLDEYSLPGRIAVIIGRNGSGKSTLLSKISRIAFASTEDRKNGALVQVGEFTPTGLGFPKIINISYSAFDSFHVPGIYIHEKQQIAKDIRSGNGRYIYCGIRDISSELELSIPELIADSRGLLSPELLLSDRQSYTILKSIDILATEFKNTYKKILQEEANNLLDATLEILRNEPSFVNLKEDFDSFDSDQEIVEYFLRQSTGHKFVLHSLMNIIAHTEPRSLVLFDEPETHLHPPLLAVLMGAIRNILNEKNAFAIVATHSPVVLQETLIDNVYIVQREGEKTKILSPEIQTYGENIGTITSHIFGLSSEITSFHSELDKIIEYYSTSWHSKDTYDKILNNLEQLFDNELSMQARAYIQSQLLVSKE